MASTINLIWKWLTDPVRRIEICALIPLVFCALLLLTFGQGQNFAGGGLILTTIPIPAGNANKGNIVSITNGSSATDCTSGGGSTAVLCQYTGAAWASIASSGTCANALTMNNSGLGAVSGSTYNCAAAVTLSYNTLGAAPLASPTFTGTVTIPSASILNTPTSINLSNATSLPCAAMPALTGPVTTPGGSCATTVAATPVSLDTSTPVTVSTTNNSEFYNNQNATAGTAVTYNLPTAAAGKQFCFTNSFNGTAADTGVLTVATSATGQFIIFTDGTETATGGNVTSGGAAADAACVVGLSSTVWQLYVQRGTWTKH